MYIGGLLLTHDAGCHCLQRSYSEGFDVAILEQDTFVCLIRPLGFTAGYPSKVGSDKLSWHGVLQSRALDARALAGFRFQGWPMETTSIDLRWLATCGGAYAVSQLSY